MKLFKEKQIEDLTELDNFCARNLFLLSIANLAVIIAFFYSITQASLGGMYLFLVIGLILTFFNRKGNIAHSVYVKAGQLPPTNSSVIGHTVEGKGILSEEDETKKYKKRDLRKKLQQGDFL